MKRSINPEDLCHSIGKLKIIIESMPNSITYYIGELGSPVDVMDVDLVLECLVDECGELPFRMQANDRVFSSDVAQAVFPLIHALIINSELN
jgi:hypothetical protein